MRLQLPVSPPPSQSCDFSRAAGEDGAPCATVSSSSGQGLVSCRGCESRLEDVCPSPVSPKNEADLLRKKRKSFGELLDGQANTGGLLVKTALE